MTPVESAYNLAKAIEHLALGMREAAMGEDCDFQLMNDHFLLHKLYLLRLGSLLPDEEDLDESP